MNPQELNLGIALKEGNPLWGNAVSVPNFILVLKKTGRVADPVKFYKFNPDSPILMCLFWIRKQIIKTYSALTKVTCQIFNKFDL